MPAGAEKPMLAVTLWFGALDNNGGTASRQGDAAAGSQGLGSVPDQPQAVAPNAAENTTRLSKTASR